MKTVKSIFAALVLLIATSMTAAIKPVEELKVNAQASQEIAKLLRVPAFEIKEDISAFASLLVNEEGELVVLCVKTDNEQVENFVKSRLNYHKIEAPLTPGKIYKLPLKLTSN